MTVRLPDSDAGGSDGHPMGIRSSPDGHPLGTRSDAAQHIEIPRGNPIRIR